MTWAYYLVHTHEYNIIAVYTMQVSNSVETRKHVISTWVQIILSTCNGTV